MRSNSLTVIVLLLLSLGIVNITALEIIYLSPSSSATAPDCGSKETPCGSLLDATCVATCHKVNPTEPINVTTIYALDGVYSGAKNYGVEMSGTCGGCPNGPYYSIAKDFRIIGGTPENVNLEPKANISCAYNIGGFRSSHNSQITLSGLIFDKCRPYQTGVLSVYAFKVNLSVHNCIFTKSLGNPINVWNGGRVNITGSVFSYNKGMGRYLDGSGVSIQTGHTIGMEANIDNCTFIGNTNFNTKDGSTNRGAAIYFNAMEAYGTLKITNSHFERNLADQGGALCLYNVTATVEHTSFVKNSAMGSGGVIYLGNGANARLCDGLSYSDNLGRKADLAVMYISKLVCNTTLFTADKIDDYGNNVIEDCWNGPTKKPAPPLTPESIHRDVVSWQIATGFLIVLLFLLGGCSMVCYYKKKARYAKITSMYKL